LISETHLKYSTRAIDSVLHSNLETNKFYCCIHSISGHICSMLPGRALHSSAR